MLETTYVTHLVWESRGKKIIKNQFFFCLLLLLLYFYEKKLAEWFNKKVKEKNGLVFIISCVSFFLFKVLKRGVHTKEYIKIGKIEQKT